MRSATPLALALAVLATASPAAAQDLLYQAEAGEPDLPLRGVQSCPRDMFSLLLASRRGVCRRDQPRRAAGRETHFSFQVKPT